MTPSDRPARQRAELNPDETRKLDDLVRSARTQLPREQWSHGNAQTVLEAALRHVYERSSVVREGSVLGAALELHPDFYRWRELRHALETHPESIRKDGEMTLRMIRREETATVQRVLTGRNQRFPMGDANHLPSTLTAGQRNAAHAILGSRDFMSVLIGDAGTGKTTVLTAIEGAHLAAGGRRFVSLAPTTRARDAMVESGFDGADTVQRFLVSAAMQAEAAGRVVLVDEAGLLSTQQLDQLTKVAHEVAHVDPIANKVIFTDGRELPWQHYVEARWEYGEPDLVKIEIGGWVVGIRGHNLGPLFLAMEDHTLTRVRAQPALDGDREREVDTFVIELRFTKPPAGGLGGKRGGQSEFDLGG